MTNPNFRTKIEATVLKAITDFNIADSGGMADAPNVKARIEEATEAILKAIEELEEMQDEVPEPPVKKEDSWRAGVFDGRRQLKIELRKALKR